MIALFAPVILDLIANRLVLVFTYPNIAEASARVMNHSEITFKEIVEPLFAVIKEGVEEGHKSEFVGRLLLIFLGFIVLKQYSHIIKSINHSFLEGQINEDKFKEIRVFFCTHFIAMERDFHKKICPFTLITVYSLIVLRFAYCT
ncbi:17808_t:CDS:1 [Funneliformis caledonium]|uniref:17808_t:CDS:1 n=1 Tax=Funneliformis caledonium TaxID=1117310 RepID=A0A9N9DN83_9GLOM|nr:17808_t:CDS:1 [Funneliformis caledonium]